ncbi:hypothetical protein [Streptomyces clavuligerus]|uniref:hypothetical protein n=1 Tax=Streptomyces clavuligerus TaxID=1901 RepID=UPI0030B87062
MTCRHPGLFAYRQDTGAVLSELSEVCLARPSPLSRGKRELIGAYVSGLNGTPLLRERPWRVRRRPSSKGARAW